MRRFRLFFSVLLSLIAWTGVMAQTDGEYDAAMAAIEDGGVYRIFTPTANAVYYINADGALVSKEQGEFFTLTKKTGGGYKTVGIQVSSASKRFTNAAMNSDKAVLNCGKFCTTTGNRADWESQVFFLKDGKYAIRACNVAYGESGWADCGRVFFDYTVSNADASIAAKYSYEPSYIWELEGPLSVITVTYKVVESDGTTEVTSIKKLQEANSKVDVPTSLISNFLYVYDIEGAIGDKDCTITIKREMKRGAVHSLDGIASNKTYNIGCERGMFLTKNSYLASTAHSTLNNADIAQFAIVNYENHYYLYSVADKKFVTNNGSLSDMLVNGVNDAICMTPKSDALFLYYFQINESTQNGLNTNGNDPYGYVINTYMTPDPGNQYFMLEVADFDPTDAEAALEDFFHPTYFVTYVVKDEAGNELFKSEPQPTRKGAKITTIPAQFQLLFTKYSEADVTISETETTVEFTASWDGPFQVSTSEADAKWYNMTIRSDYSVFVGAEEPYYPKKANNLQKISDEYQWAFAGNAYTGIVVFNKAKGIKYSLTKASIEGGDAAVMREGMYFWTIGKNADGFTLKERGTANNCINQAGGASGPLKFWDNGNSPTDNGSTFRISAVPTSFEWTIGDAGYATMYLPFNVNVVGGFTGEELNKVEASVATLNGEYMKLNPLGAIVPAATPVVLKAEPGTYNFYVDKSLLNCAKAVEKTTALADNTITEEDYSVVGYITNTDGKISKDQQVFWMADETDGGKVFEAYWANIPDPKTPLIVGQKVIITGKLQKYVNKSGAVTCEIKNPSVAVIDNDLRGTYEEIDAAGQYVLAKPEGKEVGFYRAASGKIAANKAFLTLFLEEGTEAREAFLFNAPEGATAIESLTPAITEGEVIYNIAGQRVNKAQKGIYIVNGKKVLF